MVNTTLTPQEYDAIILQINNCAEALEKTNNALIQSYIEINKLQKYKERFEIVVKNQWALYPRHTKEYVVLKYNEDGYYNEIANGKSICEAIDSAIAQQGGEK